MNRSFCAEAPQTQTMNPSLTYHRLSMMALPMGVIGTLLIGDGLLASSVTSVAIGAIGVVAALVLRSSDR